MKYCFIFILLSFSVFAKDVIYMGKVGKTIPVDVEKIDKVSKAIRKAFSDKQIEAAYQRAIKEDQDFYNSIVKHSRKVMNVIPSHHTKATPVFKGVTKRIVKDVNLQNMFPEGYKIVFFSASMSEKYKDLSYATARYIRGLDPKNSIGFCVYWDSHEDCSNFSKLLDNKFEFQALINDDVPNSLKITKFPSIITIKKDHYVIQEGL